MRRSGLLGAGALGAGLLLLPALAPRREARPVAPELADARPASAAGRSEVQPKHAATSVRVVARGDVSLAGWELAWSAAQGARARVVVGPDGVVPLDPTAGPFELRAPGFHPASWSAADGDEVVLAPLDSFVRLEITGLPADLDEAVRATLRSEGRFVGDALLAVAGTRGTVSFAAPAGRELTLDLDLVPADGSLGWPLGSLARADRFRLQPGWAHQRWVDTSDACELRVRVSGADPELLEGRSLLLTIDPVALAPLDRVVRSTVQDGEGRFVWLPDAPGALALQTAFGDPIALREGAFEVWELCGAAGPRRATPDERLVAVAAVEASGRPLAGDWALGLDEDPGEPVAGAPAPVGLVGGERQLLAARTLVVACARGTLRVPAAHLRRVAPTRYELRLPASEGRIEVRARSAPALVLCATLRDGGDVFRAAGREGVWSLSVPAGTYDLAWTWADGFCRRAIEGSVGVRAGETAALALEAPSRRRLPGRIEGWEAIPGVLRPTRLFVECDDADVDEQGRFELDVQDPLPASVDALELPGNRFLTAAARLHAERGGGLRVAFDWQDWCVATMSAEPLRGGVQLAQICAPELDEHALFSPWRARIPEVARTRGASFELVGRCGTTLRGWIREATGAEPLLRGWFVAPLDGSPPLVETQGAWAEVRLEPGAARAAELYVRPERIGTWRPPAVLLAQLRAGETRSVWLVAVPHELLARTPEGAPLRVAQEGGSIVIGATR